jgi:hypothetical protein
MAFAQKVGADDTAGYAKKARISLCQGDEATKRIIVKECAGC